jgi:hypothetical protein
MFKKKLVLFVSAALLLTAISGCGYKIGSLAHPQIKSIAVAPVTNDTTTYNLAAQVRGILCEAFMSDGSLKLTHLSTADCIIYTKVEGVSFSEISWSTDSGERFVPNEWRVRLHLSYTVVIPGEAAPLTSGSVTGTADFMTGPDMEIGRLNGMRQAGLSTANQIVVNTVEDW